MNRYLKAVFYPLEITLHLAASGQPQLLWRRFGRLAQKAGFKKLYLILSFDCDTPEDAKVALDLDQHLRDIGVRSVYAVPGTILEQEEKVYSRLLLRGAEFMNHGGAQHTFMNHSAGRYESCFFYDQLHLEQVRRDIEKGHQALEKVLGLRPLGFRAPHFGTFQTKAHLSFLHSLLEGMGYKYSSSTVPFYAFRHGPVFTRFGLLEFPVLGAFSRPLAIQDSWSYYAAPHRRLDPDRFLSEAKAIANFCQKEKIVGILNYYADPSHVWDQPTFFKAVKAWREVAEPFEFRSAIRLINPHF